MFQKPETAFKHNPSSTQTHKPLVNQHTKS